MEWYLGCGVDDLVVPRDQDIFDSLPSPNSWSQWELPSSGSGINFIGKSHYKELGMDLFKHQVVQHSSKSNASRGFKAGSLDQDTTPQEELDYQFSDSIHATNQTDGIFLNSFHEENPIGMETSTRPFDFYHPEFENNDYGVFLGDYLLEDMVIDSDCDPSHLFGLGSSKYPKTHAFSLSLSESSLQTPQLPKLKDNPPSPPVKAHLEEDSVSSEFETMDELANDETALEASVLQELESVMSQMSEHTRICFRDALYRLAENSRKHSLDLILEMSPPLMMVHDGNLRPNAKSKESETNAIDRAVANLMFYKMDCNVQGLPADCPAHCPSSSSGDAEVPIFS